MKLLAARLAVTAALFAAWIGYLGYLVATRPVRDDGSPLVLSRPQILTSPIDVLAKIDDPAAEVTVEQVLWPDPRTVKLKPGDKVRVLDLEKCRPLRWRAGKEPPPDFAGPGVYLIPLRQTQREGGDYEVAPVPASPGFDAVAMEEAGKRPVRIYPKTAETLSQHDQIRNPPAP